MQSYQNNKTNKKTQTEQTCIFGQLPYIQLNKEVNKLEVNCQPLLFKAFLSSIELNKSNLLDKYNLN